MIRRPTRFSPASLLLSAALPLATLPHIARAQSGVSPEAAPAAPEATSPRLNPTGPQSETTPVNPPDVTTPDVTTPGAITAGETVSGEATAVTSRLKAERVKYEGGVYFASGSPENPVRFTSAAGLILAQDVRLDMQTQQLQASGSVQFERERQISRKALRPRGTASITREETFRETAFGQNLI